MGIVNSSTTIIRLEDQATIMVDQQAIDFAGQAAKAVDHFCGQAVDVFQRFQLRDPAIFAEEGRLYLLYSVAGEQGIAIARLSRQGPPGV